ncbi:MAG: hypothetical protein AB7H90_17300 [Alphaproteobacteria bacterium]
MSNNKYTQILHLLVEQTDNGKLDWKETGNESAFLVSFPNYSLMLSEKKARDSDMPDYVISIINSEGKTVDEFSDVSLGTEYSGEDFFRLMRELFNKARRRALGVDEALNDILAHLGGGSNR